MMRFAIFLLTLGLTACVANRPADPNPNSVPNVMLSITQTRATSTHIYGQGGVYDGAAAGQTATFVIAPDNSLICTFQTDPVLVGDPPDIVRTAHRLVVPVLYAQMAAVFVPNVEPVEVAFTSNFTIQTGGANGVVPTATGFGDPRFDQMFDIFRANPTPCWLFG